MGIDLRFWTTEGPFVGANKYFEKEWVLHREDGPAVIYSDSSEEWWFMGKLHRWDGPALCNSILDMHLEEWWYKGNYCVGETHPFFDALRTLNLYNKWKSKQPFTDAERLALKMVM